MPLLNAQTVQWASKVIGYSSQYGTKTYSAQQVVGKPNVLPQFRDSPCAWSPLKEQNSEKEWIKVGFDRAQTAQQVAIAESYNPGSIVKVMVYDDSGKEYVVYKNDKVTVPFEQGRMFYVFFNPIARVKSVKVVLKTDVIRDGTTSMPLA